MQVLTVVVYPAAHLCPLLLLLLLLVLLLLLAPAAHHRPLQLALLAPDASPVLRQMVGRAARRQAQQTVQPTPVSLGQGCPMSSEVAADAC